METADRNLHNSVRAFRRLAGGEKGLPAGTSAAVLALPLGTVHLDILGRLRLLIGNAGADPGGVLNTRASAACSAPSAANSIPTSSWPVCGSLAVLIAILLVAGCGASRSPTASRATKSKPLSRFSFEALPCGDVAEPRGRPSPRPPADSQRDQKARWWNSAHHLLRTQTEYVIWCRTAAPRRTGGGVEQHEAPRECRRAEAMPPTSRIRRA